MDDSKLLRLFYFRHGETEWSLAGRHTGQSDIPLTPQGEAQARALRPCVAAAGFSLVLTSPRLRARQTAELAGAVAAGIEPDLAEWDYGDYEGLRSAEIQANRPGWNIFRDGCPGGESPDQIAARADRLIARLRAMQGNVGLFSHGHFGAALATRWIGLAVVEGEHFALNPASLSQLSYDPRHRETAVLALWNSDPGAVVKAT